MQLSAVSWLASSKAVKPHWNGVLADNVNVNLKLKDGALTSNEMNFWFPLAQTSAKVVCGASQCSFVSFSCLHVVVCSNPAEKHELVRLNLLVILSFVRLFSMKSDHECQFERFIFKPCQALIAKLWEALKWQGHLRDGCWSVIWKRTPSMCPNKQLEVSWWCMSHVWQQICWSAASLVLLHWNIWESWNHSTKCCCFGFLLDFWTHTDCVRMSSLSQQTTTGRMVWVLLDSCGCCCHCNFRCCACYRPTTLHVAMLWQKHEWPFVKVSDEKSAVGLVFR